MIDLKPMMLSELPTGPSPSLLIPLAVFQFLVVIAAITDRSANWVAVEFLVT